MPGYLTRPYAGESDIPLLHQFASRAISAREPGLSYWHPGDVTWQLFGGAAYDPADVLQLWLDHDGAIAGLGWMEPPLNATLDAGPWLDDRADLLKDILDWSEARQREVAATSGSPVPLAYAMLPRDGLTVTALESDPVRVDLLRARSYAAGERFSYRFRRDLAGNIPEPELPPGAVLRWATDADIAGRVDVHRDAWSVWGPSSVTEDGYRGLRAAPGYDAELDVVLEAGGRLVSYCICWADPDTGFGVFEPVGTRPTEAGRGFARAVMFEGLRRLRARGMHTALVGTASVNDRAAMVYQSCGFELVEREVSWSRAVGDVDW